MNKTIFKSIGAIFAGFASGAVLSVGTDYLLEKSGIMSMDRFKQTSILIICVIIIYRFIFNLTGSYLTAKLAPGNPMKHVVIIGVVGTVLSILGSFAMWEKATPFYNIAVILISFPSAWFGGRLYIKNQQNGKANS